MVWRDSHSVTCRMWAWRQSERTKLTKQTKDVYFIFDGYEGIGVDLEKIVEEFTEELEKVFSCKTQSTLLDAKHPEFEIPYETKRMEGVSVDADLESLLKSKNTGEKQNASFLKRKPVHLGLVDEGAFLRRIGHAISDSLQGTEYETISSVSRGNSRFGDVSIIDAMKLAATVKKPPAEIAKGIAESMRGKETSTLFSKIESHPSGFVNLTFTDDLLVSELGRAVSESGNFGSSCVGNGRTMLVESPSINPNAAAHIGHLLNIFIGRALTRLFETVGFTSEIDNLINDRGIKICMAMWGVENLAPTKTPEEAQMKPDQFVGTYYVEAKQKYLEDPSVKTEIQQMLRDWESGDKKVLELWRKVVGWAYEGHKQTFDRLHEKEGHLWLESEVYSGGKDVIEKFLGKGVIERLPDGAVIGRLEEKYGVPDVILLRADGTSLYETQDIHLTMLKVEKFKPWKAVWVVGSEQLAHFQKLFALIDCLGILPVDNLYHMGYGLIVDKSGQKVGKNASDATADTVLNQMRDTALKVMSERKVTHEGLPEEEVAEAVGQGALRFAFLSKDPFRGTVYDPESALSFTGRSGPYVMYAYTRAKNVLRKALGEKPDDYRSVGTLSEKSPSISMGADERQLLLSLLMYPETVLAAANTYAPNLIAEYLYETARQFNNFYEKLTIAGAEGDQRILRLMLTRLTATVLQNGLAILGIRTLEHM